VQPLPQRGIQLAIIAVDPILFVGIIIVGIGVGVFVGIGIPGKRVAAITSHS
jgi:hypothetical protein